MKITDRQYIEKLLTSKVFELEEHNIKHRIYIGEYEVKKRILRGDIDSLEKQLEDKK